MRNVPELRYLNNTWSSFGNTVWGRSRWHSSAEESLLLGCWGWCQAFREKLCAGSSLLSLPHASSSRQAFSLPPPASCWLLCHQSIIPWNHEPKLTLAPLGHGALQQEQKSSSESFINPVQASLLNPWLFPKDSRTKREGCYSGQIGCQG